MNYNLEREASAPYPANLVIEAANEALWRLVEYEEQLQNRNASPYGIYDPEIDTLISSATERGCIIASTYAMWHLAHIGDQDNIFTDVLLLQSLSEYHNVNHAGFLAHDGRMWYGGSPANYEPRWQETSLQIYSGSLEVVLRAMRIYPNYVAQHGVVAEYIQGYSDSKVSQRPFKSSRLYDGAYLHDAITINAISVAPGEIFAEMKQVSADFFAFD